MEWFSAECEVADMRIRFLTGNRWLVPFGLGGESVPQVKEFKYLGFLFMNEGRMEHEINRQICAGAAVMWSMYQSDMVKKELSWKAGISICWLIYVPLSSMVLTARTKS